MKIHKSVQIMVILSLFVAICSNCLMAQATRVPVLVDHFDSADLNSEWRVSMTNTVDPVYLQRDGSLQILSIPPQFPGVDEYCTLEFKRAFPPLSDFEASFLIGWDSNGLDSAMQNLFIKLENTVGTVLARVGYNDTVMRYRGNSLADAGGMAFTSGLDSLPFAGTAAIRLVRTDGNLIVTWNEKTILTARVESPISQLSLIAQHYTWNGGASTFGRLSVEDVLIQGAAHVEDILRAYSAIELEWLGLGGTIYQVLMSEDLESWTIYEAGIPGENKIIRKLISTRGILEDKHWKRVFFKYAAQEN